MTPPTGLNIVGQILFFWVAKTSFAQSLNNCLYSEQTVTAYASYNRTLTSPNYPSNYDNNVECMWLIAVEDSLRFNGNIVKVTFDDLWLEQRGSLCEDVLEFYDGTSTSSRLLGSYCGRTHPEVIYSTGENMYVKFHTDFYTTYKGFSIRYSVVKEEEATGICRPWDDIYTAHRLSGSGTFFSPDYPVTYPENASCLWTIRVPVGKRVKLILEDLDLTKTFDTCKQQQSTNGMDFDFVQIGDGQDTDNKELAFHCGSFYSGYPGHYLYSTERYMWVKFHSTSPKSWETDKGFKARFEAADLAPTATERKMCYTGNHYNNELKLNGSYGTLQSPHEPSYYPPGSSCDWLITVPDGKIVKLRFDKFELRPTIGSECTADYVEILDGDRNSSNSMGRFCGFLRIPDVLNSSDRYMWVRFRADSVPARYLYGGFKATYTAEDKPISTGLLIGIIVSVIVFITIVCCIGCVVKNRKKLRGAAGVTIPMSTTTTTATHTTQPGVIQHPPPPPIQPPYQPPVNPYPPPPVGYAPVPTNPPIAASPNPYPQYPSQPPPLYPGNETVPPYPTPGQSYPWLQSAPEKASAPPGSP